MAAGEPDQRAGGGAFKGRYCGVPPVLAADIIAVGSAERPLTVGPGFGSGAVATVASGGRRRKSAPSRRAGFING